MHQSASRRQPAREGWRRFDRLRGGLWVGSPGSGVDIVVAGGEVQPSGLDDAEDQRPEDHQNEEEVQSHVSRRFQ